MGEEERSGREEEVLHGVCMWWGWGCERYIEREEVGNVGEVCRCLQWEGGQGVTVEEEGGLRWSAERMAGWRGCWPHGEEEEGEKEPSRLKGKERNEPSWLKGEGGGEAWA